MVFDVEINKRECDYQDHLTIINQVKKMSNNDKKILETAVLIIMYIFDKDPNNYQFDFRFNRK